MDILIWNLLWESILDLGKWSNLNYANYANWHNWRNFSCTTSQSPKLIPKAYFKWEFHISITNFFGAFRSSQKNVQKWISHCISKKWFGWGGEWFCCKKTFWKSQTHGNMPKFFMVTCPKFNSIVGLLSPSPYSM